MDYEGLNDSQNKGSYENAMAILKAALERRYTVLTEVFIKEGPERLRQAMNFDNEKDWEELFDYLVTKQGVIKKCVLNYMDFFKEIVEKKGPYALRRIFKIESGKYDLDFEEVFDLVAVSTGALYEYVNNNKVVLAGRIQSGESLKLRYELGIEKKKYDGLWVEILDMLMNAVCEKYYDIRTFEHGITAFSNLINSLRTHRSLRSYRKMWEFCEAREV